MKENNRFIKKFEAKSRLDLENYIENPSSYEPLAVEAAKWLLENKDFDKRKNEAINENLKEEPQLVEKAFFKNKMLSTLVKLLLLVYSLVLLFVSFYRPSFYAILWTIIITSCFVILISKHRNTVKYLQLLAILALMILGIQYVIHFVNWYSGTTELNLVELFTNDYKLITACLLMIFLGESLIETRYVPK